jgi:hypothetical protein
MMNIRVLCDFIRLHPDARRVLEHFALAEDVYEAWKREFTEDADRFFAKVCKMEHFRQRLLYFFVRLAVDLHEEYRIRGIGDDVYAATFSDLTIWSEECKRRFGEYGIQEYRWLAEHANLRLFRLGRLQFQPYVLDQDVETADGRTIRKHTIVLNVHIPAGEPLHPDSVQHAFERAVSFFRGIPPVFVCYSWLLEPQLHRLLPPESNILQFQNCFHIFRVHAESRQAEERIFGQIRENPEEYEERTQLQRKAKAHLLEGKKLGLGCGIRVGC